MLIEKRSNLTGKLHTKDLDITQEQIDDWKSGTLIQRAMPNLTPDEREFLISGSTAEEWNTVFNESEQAANETDEHLEQ